ncbi:MAG TPA: hypothetical protein VMW29_03890 [Candidatus Bathyarchaeia archaeon]|nr:hypothetical protein [Candidatus Bathyarchaeia archaeon]
MPIRLVTQVKEQIQTLKIILEKEPNYSIVKATNGQFCKPQ